MNDLATLQEKLEKTRAEAERLAEQIEQQRAKELTALPKQVGLGSVDELIKALVDHASPRLRGLLRTALDGGQKASRSSRAASTAKSSAASGTEPGNDSAASGGKVAGRRTRAKITDDTRAEVKRLVAEDKTGAEIATMLGISLPSVQNIKKALGLVKKRN